MWTSLRKRRGQMMGHTLRHGRLRIDVLERKGEKMGRPRLEYVSQIIKDVGCE